MTSGSLIISLSISLAVSILGNIVTLSLLAFVNSEGLRFLSPNNKDMKGPWTSATRTKTKGTLFETVHIQRQILGLIFGTLTTLIDGVHRNYNFRGRFIKQRDRKKQDLVRYWFWSNDKGFADHGIGMFQITGKGDRAEGIAVFYGAATQRAGHLPNIESAKFTLVKH